MGLFLTLGGESVKHCDAFKYLGVVLDNSLSFNLHIDYVKKKVSGGISLEGFIVARNVSTPNLVLPEVRTRSKTAAINSMPARKKLLMTVHLLNSTLLANLLLLCNDVFLNPGPVDANADLSFSSFAFDECFTLSFGTASSM